MTQTSGASQTLDSQRDACAYRVLRYTPNLVRDEWVNIGVLVYNPATGERRLRLLEDPGEFARVRRLHPHSDESLLRALRDDIERQFDTATGDWRDLLAKWDNTLSNAVQLAPQKGVLGGDLDSEIERLYADHVALPAPRGEASVRAGSRGSVRNYCGQVFRQARLWERLEKNIHAEQFTFPGDPMRLDYGYRRNGTRGFVQALSVTRAPADAKLLAYTAARIRAQAINAEFAAVTDVALSADNERHRFVRETLRDAGVDPVPLENFAVWVAKLKPLLQ
jgi:hypothetical protein